MADNGSSHRFTMHNAQQDQVISNLQEQLSSLKTNISRKSKYNFELEKTVRKLDEKISLLINNRITLEEVQQEGLLENNLVPGKLKDERKRIGYGHLFYLLQTEPRYIASLARSVNTGQIDTLLRTVMFTLFGNQYESREEHLLLDMFRVALDQEFSECTALGSLMRSNTAITRMMTTYTRRGPGEAYLKSLLSGPITKLVEEDINLEINPLKVYEQYVNEVETETGKSCDLPRGVDSETAGKHPEVAKRIDQRVERLCTITNEFLDLFIESIPVIPYGIRWICKQIRVLMTQYFPEADEHVVASLIGGFYLLRFINPAIVTPSANHLVTTKPSRNTARSFVLLAKVLQVTANKPNLNKEPYMAPFVKFVEDNKSKVTQFFINLCDVDDFQGVLELDHYLSLARSEIQISIRLNEISSIHSLLLEFQSKLCKNKDRLSHILEDLGPASEKIPMAENKSVVLDLASRWAQSLKTSSAGNQSTYSTILQNVVSVAVSCQSAPLFHSCMAEDVIKTLEEQAQSNLPKVATPATKALQLIGMYSDEDSVALKADNYATLRKDVELELKSLDGLRDRLAEELASLKSVYSDIDDHHKYLELQIDDFKAYLGNVREQSMSSSTTKPKKKDKKKGGRVGPFKYSHVQLEKDGIITFTEVPDDKKSSIFFNFLSDEPGVFIWQLLYKGRAKPVMEGSMRLDDLLERQHNSQLVFETESIHFKITLLVHLLNKHFRQ